MREGTENAKHRAQWSSTLDLYAKPTIGKMLVQDIDLSHVLIALEAIWTTKTETGSRLRGRRIETVLDWATVRGQRILRAPSMQLFPHSLSLKQSLDSA